MSDASTISTASKALQAGLWLTILLIAFFMQVVPFLLVLTMINLAFGVTSGVALVMIPVVAFGMLSIACIIATRRTKRLVQPPLQRQVYIAPYDREGGKQMEARTVHACLLPHFRRWRWKLY